MSTEAEVRQWVREEHERLLMEDQAACLHKRSASLNLGAGDIVDCDDCRKKITFDPACRRPPKSNPKDQTIC